MIAILVVDADPTNGEALASALRAILGDLATVELVADARAAAASAGGRPDVLVPVVFIDGDSHRAGQTAIEVHELPELGDCRNVLVTSNTSLVGVDLALRRGAVHGMMTRPWTTAGLEALLTANLATFLVEHAPDRLAEFRSILDDDVRHRAEERVAQRRAATSSPASTTPLLLDSSIPDDEVERRMIEMLDRALGHPPRIRVAAGTVMIESGDDVGGIYVVLDGTVTLSSTTPTGEHILHHQSTGAIIGLLSLASHRRAMLQCRAVTDVRAVPVTLTQLAQALSAEPELSSLLTRVLITSLARRLRRSDELQVELDQSLSDLSEARAQLVAAARFAALGELAAGMAHELNNPTAALARSAEHLRQDLDQLVGEPDLRAIIDRRIKEEPPAPSAQRAARRALDDAEIAPALAARLLDAGLTGEEIAALIGHPMHEIERIERVSRVGRSLRTMSGAAERIQTLVGSLRSYLRNEDGRGPVSADVDVTATIDDALRLVDHRMGDVQLHRAFSPTPPIVGRPGALQQVWTNLVTNALDAIDAGGGAGEITVSVAPGADGTVQIHVTDNGPGIPAELQERIFEPRFTTKDGRVQFGLGLGLSISRQIVEDHGGFITVSSEPGRTDLAVVLPIGGRS